MAEKIKVINITNSGKSEPALLITNPDKLDRFNSHDAATISHAQPWPLPNTEPLTPGQTLVRISAQTTLHSGPNYDGDIFTTQEEIVGLLGEPIEGFVPVSILGDLKQPQPTFYLSHNGHEPNQQP